MCIWAPHQKRHFYKKRKEKMYLTVHYIKLATRKFTKFHTFSSMPPHNLVTKALAFWQELSSGGSTVWGCGLPRQWPAQVLQDERPERALHQSDCGECTSDSMSFWMHPYWQKARNGRVEIKIYFYSCKEKQDVAVAHAFKMILFFKV